MTDLRDDRVAREKPPVIVRRRRPFRPAVEGEAWRDDPWDDTDAVIAPVVERERPSRWPFKVIGFGALSLVVVALLVAGSVGWWYIHKINPEGDPGAAIGFSVEEGDTIESVSERLELQGLVSDASVFRWYVDRQGGIELTPGFYQIRPRDHMGNVMLALATPPELTYRQVTFPEGFTMSRMASRLAEEVPLITYGEYMAAATDGSVSSEYLQYVPGTTSLEGLLFPDTYQVSNGETAADVIRRQVEMMERVGRQEQIVEKGYALRLTAYDVLIIASMVEREAKTAEDRPLVARVILNRLFEFDEVTYPGGMPLQIDATLFYGQDADLPVSQLRQIDTPYNTYMYPGLPPTPIANPGRASIQAVLNPAPDPPAGGPMCADLPRDACHWYYYVLSPEGDGSHVFAVTLEQHEANVAAALEAGVL